VVIVAWFWQSDAMTGTAQMVGRWLLALFYAVAGVAHLLYTDAMVRIVPLWVPAPHAVVIATGVAELAGAIGVMIPATRRVAGWALAAYALCVWPANIRHAIMDLSTGTGLPLAYHVPRLLLQPAIIWWALWASGAIRGRVTRR
jgi:uncharacterized membrane protein